jgi:glycosyltransferase involved in cell wall biosynthesis
MITIFTPSFADEADTNAQNLTVKEVVARLDSSKAAVTMLHEGASDPRLAARPNTRLLQWRKHGNTAWTICHLLSKTPDVYFFPREGPLDAAFLSLRRQLRLKTAVVTYIVSGGLYVEPYRPARVRNIREADAVVANNIYLSQLLHEKMGVQAGVVYDGIDRRYFFPPHAGRDSSQGVSVLFAGSLRSYKRVPLVVQQAARWPQVQFRIAGMGEEEQKCRTLAVELRCNNVEFLGHLTSARLGEEMRRADIFFFPSIVEGHPQVLGQAAACGLPALAMSIYRPDYVINGKTGFLADSDADLFQKLDFLIGDSKQRQAMGEAAVAHAKQFDWDVVAAQWLGVFEAVVARRQRH